MQISKSTVSVLTIISIITVIFILAACKQGASTSDSLGTQADIVNPEQKLKEMGVQLYPMDAPIANYVQAVRTGNLVFLAGHGPRKPEGGFMTGKVGGEIDLETAKEAARLTAISLLSSLKGEIGDLSKVKRVVKVFGMLNAVASFTAHSQVINSCSDFLVAVFGERGKHARAAVGMGSLPMNIPVEIEMIVEVESD